MNDFPISYLQQEKTRYQPIYRSTRPIFKTVHADRAATTIHQFCFHATSMSSIYHHSSLRRRGCILILRVNMHYYAGSFPVPVHHYTLEVFFFQSTYTLVVSCASPQNDTGSFPQSILLFFQLLITTSESFRPALHRCSWPERCLSLCALVCMIKERPFVCGRYSSTTNRWDFSHHNFTSTKSFRAS